MLLSHVMAIVMIFYCYFKCHFPFSNTVQNYNALSGQLTDEITAAQTKIENGAAQLMSEREGVLYT
jgi:hypothetical protein